MKNEVLTKKIKYSISHKMNESIEHIQNEDDLIKVKCMGCQKKSDIPILNSHDGLSKTKCFHCIQHLHIYNNCFLCVLDTKHKKKKIREHVCNDMQVLILNPQDNIPTSPIPSRTFRMMLKQIFCPIYHALNSTKR